MTKLNYLEFDTLGKNEIINITGDLIQLVERSDITDGNILVFVPGATGALSTIEFEPGLIEDFPELMEKLIPENRNYSHNETWHDGNGHSHLRATLVGPSITIPFFRKKLLLGTWQQVIFLEFDNKPHRRKIVAQINGE